jgi:hypothetical protein
MDWFAVWPLEGVLSWFRAVFVFMDLVILRYLSPFFSVQINIILPRSFSAISIDPLL